MQQYGLFGGAQVIRVGPRGGQIVRDEGGKPEYQHHQTSAGRVIIHHSEKSGPLAGVIRHFHAAQLEKGAVKGLQDALQAVRALKKGDHTAAVKSAAQAASKSKAWATFNDAVHGASNRGLFEAAKALMERARRGIMTKGGVRVLGGVDWDAMQSRMEKAIGDEAKKEGTATRGTSHAVVTTRRINPADLLLDKRFQNRTDVNAEGFNQASVDGMIEGAKKEGHDDGWDPVAYDPIKVWVPEGQDPETTNQLYVVGGFHRTATARQTKRAEVDTILISGVPLEEAQRIAARTNMSVRPTDPLDDGKAFRARLDAGETPKQISQTTNQADPKKVRKLADLTYLSPTIQDDFKQNKISLENACTLGWMVRDSFNPETGKHDVDPATQKQLAEHAFINNTGVLAFRSLCTGMLSNIKNGDFTHMAQDSLFGETGNKGVVALQNVLKDMQAKQRLEAKGKAARSAWSGLIDAMKAAGQEVPAEFTAALEVADRMGIGHEKTKAEKIAERVKQQKETEAAVVGDINARATPTAPPPRETMPPVPEKPMPLQFGHHVRVNGKPGIYLRDWGEGEHHVYTGPEASGRASGVETVHGKDIRHAPPEVRPPQKIVEGAHAHPVGMRQPHQVIEIGPKGGKRTAFYIDAHGKKKWTYLEDEGGPGALLPKTAPPAVKPTVQQAAEAGGTADNESRIAQRTGEAVDHQKAMRAHAKHAELQRAAGNPEGAAGAERQRDYHERMAADAPPPIPKPKPVKEGTP